MTARRLTLSSGPVGLGRYFASQRRRPNPDLAWSLKRLSRALSLAMTSRKESNPGITSFLACV